MRSVYPQVFVLDSREKLDKYYNENEYRYDFTHKEVVYADSTIGFVDAIKKYDDQWFDTHQLVVVLLQESSGSNRHEVTRVTKGTESLIQINRIIPFIGTDDLAQWHILIELKGGAFSPSDKIQVIFSDKKDKAN